MGWRYTSHFLSISSFNHSQTDESSFRSPSTISYLPIQTESTHACGEKDCKQFISVNANTRVLIRQLAIGKEEGVACPSSKKQNSTIR
jgi:hypothetical protein